MMNEKTIIDRLHYIIEDTFKPEDLEFLLGPHEKDNDPIIEAFKDILRKKYNKKDLKYLFNKESMGKNIKNVVADIYRDYVRDSIKEEKYYHVWKMDNGDLFKAAQENVLNEFKYSEMRYKAFICHFTENDDIATNIKSFLEFYAIPTFVDHEDGNQHAGGEWEKTNENECKNRPIFIVLVRNKIPTVQIRNEIFWDKTERTISPRRLRINLVLEELSEDNHIEFEIQKEKYQYIEHHYIQDSCDDIFKSIRNFYKKII